MLALNCTGAAMMYFFASHLYRRWPALAVKQISLLSSDFTVSEREKKETDTSTPTGGFYEVVTLFFHSGCAGAMVAYSILYFSVLTFGSLMTVYLRSISISDNVIGIARGANAISVFLGASMFPWFKSTFGLYKSGTYAIAYQTCLVVLAASSFVFLDVGLPYVNAIVLMSTVVASRAGLWLFDLCVRQLAQEAIPECSRGAVNGLWNSLISFFNIATYIAAMTCPKPETFWVLTTVSAFAVVAALVIFCATLPSDECVVVNPCCCSNTLYVSIDTKNLSVSTSKSMLGGSLTKACLSESITSPQDRRPSLSLDE